MNFNLFVFFVFIFGAIVGSFLNALIYRLPREISIVTPRSSCTSCNKIISWYENIPILSYVFLRGKCSSCSSKISIMYPIVEILSGVVAILLAPNNLNPNSLLSFFFFFSVYSAFLVHIIVDLKHQILPDSINLYLGLLFFLISILNNSFLYIGLGFVVGFGFPYLISFIFYKLKGQIGLGGGDIKLWGALGIYLGPMGIIQNIFLSCLFGSIIGGFLLLFKVIKKDNPIPFGPFIILVAIIQIFFQNWFEQISRYIS